MTTTAPHGIVLDMEGVLHIGYEPIPGAAEAVRTLRASGRRLVILTNTTGTHRRVIAKGLANIGFAFDAADIVTAASATAAYLRRRHADQAVLLLAEAGARSEFSQVRLVDDAADAGVVCIGGPDNALCHPRLQDAFAALMRGAAFVAMQRNRWWPTAAGPGLDAGAYVRGLEYATRRRARVIGKPSPAVYREALRRLGLAPGDALMVGDDPVSDLAPAHRIGMGTCLVRTGKGASFDTVDVPCAYDLDALANLPAALGDSAAGRCRQ